MLLVAIMPLLFVGTLMLLYALRRNAALFPIAIAAWPAAFWYNQWILSRCPGDCGIRLDLIIVVPLLLLVSYLAVKEAWRRRR
jgi:hypothetical protein